MHCNPIPVDGAFDLALRAYANALTMCGLTERVHVTLESSRTVQKFILAYQDNNAPARGCTVAVGDQGQIERYLAILALHDNYQVLYVGEFRPVEMKWTWDE